MFLLPAGLDRLIMIRLGLSGNTERSVFGLSRPKQFIQCLLFVCVLNIGFEQLHVDVVTQVLTTFSSHVPDCISPSCVQILHSLS